MNNGKMIELMTRNIEKLLDLNEIREKKIARLEEDNERFVTLIHECQDREAVLKEEVEMALETIRKKDYAIDELNSQLSDWRKDWSLKSDECERAKIAVRVAEQENKQLEAIIVARKCDIDRIKQTLRATVDELQQVRSECGQGADAQI